MGDGARRRGANKAITFAESALTPVGDVILISDLDITRPRNLGQNGPLRPAHWWDCSGEC